MIFGRMEGLVFHFPNDVGDTVEDVVRYIRDFEKEFARWSRVVEQQFERRAAVVGEGSYDDVRVPALAMKLGGVNDPVLANLVSATLAAYSFPTGVLSELFFTVQIPHSYKEGSDITPHVHWAPVNASAGNVRWGLEYEWQNRNSAFPSSTTITVEQATAGTAWQHQVAELAAITGSGMENSSQLACRIFRDGAHANDTYGSPARLLEVGFHYLQDALGADEPLGSHFIA